MVGMIENGRNLLDHGTQKPGVSDLTNDLMNQAD